MTGFSKSYVQTQLAAADPADHKSSVRVASLSALPAYTRVGNVITANANGALPAIGGVTLTVNQSFLFLHGAAGQDNGIYVVTQVGSGGAPFILTRRGDSNTNEFVNCGMRVPIEEGKYAGSEFVLVTPNPITLNTTALEFEEISSGGGGAPTVLLDDDQETIPENRSIQHVGDILVDEGDINVEGDLSGIDFPENHAVLYIPTRQVRRVRQNEVMYYEDLVIDGVLEIDGDVAPFPIVSGQDILDALTLIAPDTPSILGVSSPASFLAPAAARAVMNVPSNAEMSAAISSAVGAIPTPPNFNTFWDISSNPDGTFSGSDSTNITSFTALINRINKWAGNIPGIVATLPAGSPTLHNRVVAFYESASDSTNYLQIDAPGGSRIRIPGSGVLGQVSISVGGDRSYCALRYDASSDTWEVVEGHVYVANGGNVSPGVLAFFAGSLGTVTVPVQSVLGHMRTDGNFGALTRFQLRANLGDLDPALTSIGTGVQGTLFNGFDSGYDQLLILGIAVTGNGTASLQGLGYNAYSTSDTFSRIKYITNVSINDNRRITFLHNDAGASAGQKFFCPGGVAYTIWRGETVMLWNGTFNGDTGWHVFPIVTKMPANSVLVSDSTGIQQPLIYAPNPSQEAVLGVPSSGSGWTTILTGGAYPQVLGKTPFGDMQFHQNVSNAMTAPNIIHARNVQNGEGTALPYGAAVYVTAGESGQIGTPVIGRGQADATGTAKFFGVVAPFEFNPSGAGEIPASSAGYVVTGGPARIDASVQTGTWQEGDRLYLDPATPGKITNVRPTAYGHFIVPIGVVLEIGVSSEAYILIEKGPIEQIRQTNIDSELLVNAGATTVLETYTTTTNSRLILFYLTVQAADTAGDSAMYEIIARFKRDSGGTVTQVAVVKDVESEIDATWDVDFNISGSNIQIRGIADGANNTRFRVVGRVTESTIP